MGRYTQFSRVQTGKQAWAHWLLSPSSVAPCSTGSALEGDVGFLRAATVTTAFVLGISVVPSTSAACYEEHRVNPLLKVLCIQRCGECSDQTRLRNDGSDKTNSGMGGGILDL